MPEEIKRFKFSEQADFDLEDIFDYTEYRR